MANKTLSIAVMSGKGGVGKTNLSLNLGCGLHQAGYSALLMDCDLGLANLDVLLGIMPEGNLQHALMGDMPLRKILHPVEPRGFDVLPAASGVPEMAELGPDMQHELLQKLEPVFAAYDFVLMDLGAGISQTVQYFASLAAMRLVIITPEPTSLTDSYAFMKVLHAKHGMNDFMVVVNQATSAREAQTAFDKLKRACVHFLEFEPQYLGHVRTDPKLPEAVCRQQPLMRYAPGSPASQDMEKLAVRLQKQRLGMLDWLAQRPVLQVPAL